MVKGIDQKSLIEELLRLWLLGGYGMVQVSQSGHQSRRLGLRVSMVLLGCDDAAQQEGEQNGEP